MNSPQRVLVLTGLFLIAFTMAFGVWYAIFDEHQTLVGMGVHMATGFAEMAAGNPEASTTALENYADLSREYGREVHAHGHWGMLSLVLIIIGLAFNRLSLGERQGLLLAWLLALSAALFPLGVLLQIGPAAGLGKLLSVPASLGMVLGLLVSAWALIKEK
jgi:hypothetical protein